MIPDARTVAPASAPCPRLGLLVKLPVLLLVLVLGAAIGGGEKAWGQDQGYTLLYDLPAGPGRGASGIAGGTDLNGDAYADYLVHYTGIKVGESYQLPTVAIFSGWDGRLLWAHDEDLPPGTWPTAWASDLGDVDGDGRPDLVIGNVAVPTPSGRGLGRVQVMQCDSGHKVWERYADDGDTLGGEVRVAGDLNGDGRAEVLCRYAHNPNGDVAVLSGLDGDYLYRYGGSGVDLNQTQVGGLGDVDLDGFGDFAIGAFDQPPAGIVWVYSGATGQIIWTIEPIPGEHLGPFVAGPGDLNRDGHADIVSPGFEATYAYSGRDGTLLWAAPYVGDAYGPWPVAYTSDDDNDGVPEVLATQINGYHSKGGVAVFSGSTGRFLTQVSDPRDKRLYFGLNDVRGTSDVNGDGLGDWIVLEGDQTAGEYNGFGRAVIVARKSLRSVEAAPMGNDPYLHLSVPAQPSKKFALLFSLSADVGVPLGTRTIPLDGDALFRHFIEQPFFGSLDAAGQADIQFSRHSWPPIGDVLCSAIVLDDGAPLGVRTISNNAPLPVR